MSFVQATKRLLEQKIKTAKLNVLIFGPGRGTSGYEKRQQIRDRLREEFPESDILFSEDLSKSKRLKNLPLASPALLAHEQEQWHVLASDLCIVLDMSLGPGEEIASFANTMQASKLLVLTEERYKDSTSYAASLRRSLNQLFFTKEEYEKCTLVNLAINRLRQVAVQPLLFGR